MDPPDAHPRKHQVQFGKGIKPFYVSQPSQDVETNSRITKTLKQPPERPILTFWIFRC
jgi:hypothetical protein